MTMTMTMQRALKLAIAALLLAAALAVVMSRASGSRLLAAGSDDTAARVRYEECGELGIAHLGNVAASNIVHDSVEPIVADNIDPLVPDTAVQVHNLNCSLVVPVEGTVDQQLTALGL